MSSDDTHKISTLSDDARYLTGFYFDSRYPGDNYAEVEEGQSIKAKECAERLEEYFLAELKDLNQEEAKMPEGQSNATLELKKLN